ncbi:hypothetical protein L218DRAFT_953382 [Marasmius fiardii PR-910]|nr:hypothetical protein L218DRAFT_953382 [Marasmius fiardii PR-910]
MDPRSSLANWDGSRSTSSQTGLRHRTLLFPSPSVQSSEPLSQYLNVIDTTFESAKDGLKPATKETSNLPRNLSPNFTSRQSGGFIGQERVTSSNWIYTGSQNTSPSSSFSSLMGAMSFSITPMKQIQSDNRTIQTGPSVGMNGAGVRTNEGHGGSLPQPLSAPYLSSTFSTRLSTPPTYPNHAESLFTPPGTTLSADSLFTPPPSPDIATFNVKSPRQKKTVYRMSHVLVPSLPKNLTRAHYLKLPDFQFDPLSSSSITDNNYASTSTCGPFPTPQTTLADSMNQASTSNHNTPYPSASELGVDHAMIIRRRKKPEHLRHGITYLADPDFEDEMEDGVYESSLGARKQNESSSKLRKIGESSSTPSKKKWKGFLEKKKDKDLEARRISKTPARTPPRLFSPPTDSPLFSPELNADCDIVHADFSRTTETSLSSSTNAVASLRRSQPTARSNVVEFELPLSWLSRGSNDYPYHATALNTRFARKSSISRGRGNPIAIARKSTSSKGELKWSPSWTIRPLRRHCSDSEEDEVLTHGLRPISKIKPVRLTRAGSSSLSGTIPSSMPSEETAKKRFQKGPPEVMRVTTLPSPTPVQSRASSRSLVEANETSRQLPSDKGKAKQHMASDFSASYSPEDQTSRFPCLYDDEQPHPSAPFLSQQQAGLNVFQRPDFPLLAEGHIRPADTRDEALPTFAQPPSPPHHTFTNQDVKDTPPIHDYVGLENNLGEYPFDNPVPRLGLDLSFGDLAFIQVEDGTDLLPNPLLRRNEQGGCGTIDPSVFASIPDILSPRELVDDGDESENSIVPQAEPQHVFYEGSKLPPRSVSRVISVQARPRPVSVVSIPIPASLQNTYSDLEQEGDDEKSPIETRNTEDDYPIVAGPSLCTPFPFLDGSTSYDDDEYESSDSSEDGIYVDPSSANEKDEENTVDISLTLENQDEERGPYAKIYNMMPPRDAVPARGQQWPKGDRELFCHQCRARSNRVHVSCGNYECTKHWCIKCLVTRYEDGTFSFLKTVMIFECPRCHDYCTCDVCSRRRGEEYVPLRSDKRFSKGEKSLDSKGKATARRRLGGKTNLPSIETTDATDEPLQYWGPVYDLECTHPIAKCFVLNGDSDSRVLAQPLAPPRKRRKRKKRVMFLGSLQPGWKKPSKQTSDVSPVNTDIRKRYYVGRRPPPIVPDDGEDSPLTDLEDDSEGERKYGNFWHSESNDEDTSNNDTEDHFEREKRYLSRNSKERNSEATYDDHGLPTSFNPDSTPLEDHVVASVVQSALGSIGVQSYCAL